MVEVRNDLGFGQVSFDIFRARNSLGAGNLDRNGAIEIVIKGLKDLAETALPKPPQQIVTPDFRRMEKREGFLGILAG
jgi:hypothetical protein